jgi:hypothetical protein
MDSYHCRINYEEGKEFVWCSALMNLRTSRVNLHALIGASFETPPSSSLESHQITNNTLCMYPLAGAIHRAAQLQNKKRNNPKNQRMNHLPSKSIMQLCV